jgi:hypothetical protein
LLHIVRLRLLSHPSLVAAPSKEGLPNSLRVTGIEDYVPKPTGDAVSHFHALTGVVVKVVSLEVPKIRVPEIVEVNAMMNPFFSDIALDHSSKQNRQSVNGKQKTQGSGNAKERKQVFQLTTDVHAIEWTLVMFPVKRVKAFVREAPYESFSRRKPSVQNEAVENVFDESPDRKSRQEENHGHPGMRCSQTENEHGRRVNGIKGS